MRDDIERAYKSLETVFFIMGHNIAFLDRKQLSSLTFKDLKFIEKCLLDKYKMYEYYFEMDFKDDVIEVRLLELPF